MHIPLEIVKKGEVVIDKYIELSEKIDQLQRINSESFKNFFNQIENIKTAIKDIENKHLYRQNPYFDEEKNEWRFPNLQALSRFSDSIWTYQRHFETSLSEYGSGIYEYVKATEKLNKLFD